MLLYIFYVYVDVNALLLVITLNESLQLYRDAYVDELN